MPELETRYARARDADIAYQVVGDGPVDLVWAYGLHTNIEVMWEEPSLAAMFLRLAEFSRLLLLDRRGSGLSDRGERHLTPTLEERVADIAAVLDAVGSRRAWILGVSEGGALAAVFASMLPRRTQGIIVYGGIAQMIRDDAHPWGWLDAAEARSLFEPIFQGWGTTAGAAEFARLIAPSMAGDEEYVAWFARQQRQSLSRDAVVAFFEAISRYDVDDVYPAVRVPTLVLHRTGDLAIPVSQARHIASRTPGATLVELPGSDHLPYVGDADSVIDAIRRFIQGQPESAPTDRQLVTLLATDSSDADAQAMVERHIARFDGTALESRDGGVLARFATTTRAIRCGLGIVDAAARRDVGLRAGVHTGECEISDDRVIIGLAARVPAALVDLAEPGQVLVSGTVRDLIPGSGIQFSDERRVNLRGFPGEFTVLSVINPSTPSAEPGPEPDEAGGHRGVPIPGRRSNVFRLDGEYWTVGFDGRVVTLRNSKGMHDLGVLLANPGRECHVLDLWSGPGGRPSRTADAAADGRVTSHRAEPVIDDVARDNYRRRIADLEEDVVGASDRGDPHAVSQARAEREWLVDELAAAYGLAGRPRRMPDEVERARKAVRRRINDALRRIEQANLQLGRHLRHSVHTGVYCSYAPEHDVRWDTTHDDSAGPDHPDHSIN